MRRRIIAMFIICSLAFTGCTSNSEPEEGDSNVDFNENDYKNITDKNNQFGLKMLNRLSKDTDENIFISPISQYMALSMLYQGADEETKSELAELLNLNGLSAEEVNKANASLLDKLISNDNELQLQIANSLWVDSDFKLNKDYQNIIQDYYRATVETIDGNNKAETDQINQWVAEKTNDKIKQMVDGPLGDDFAAMLVNAVYFKGSWTFPFDPDATEEGNFHMTDGETADAPFMHMQKKLDYLKEDNFETVRLPYGEEGNQNMYLFLPSKSAELKDIHADLLENGISDITGRLEERAGTIALPKFKMDYEKELNDILEDLGMTQAFDKNKAQFPNIIEGTDELFVSEVKHMTFLEIDENGTEAAGATSIGMETTSAPAGEPFDLTFDRPFFLLILDEPTGTVLFAGDINNVSE